MSSNQVDAVISTIVDWAMSQTAIRALALAGSYARGDARANSDIDFVALVTDPKTFKTDMAWPAAIPWPGMQLAAWQDEHYGVIWSRRLWLDPSLEVEMSFGPLTWADVNPVDAGTRQVVSGGLRILHDPEGVLMRLCAACSRESTT